MLPGPVAPLAGRLALGTAIHLRFAAACSAYPVGSQRLSFASAVSPDASPATKVWTPYGQHFNNGREEIWLDGGSVET